MRAEALKLFRKLFLNKYARVINNYFGLLCHTCGSLSAQLFALFCTHVRKINILLYVYMNV
jgi:hypothetical protein